MTLSELLTNEELRQEEFPVTRHKIYLAHGGVCPLPRRVAEAMRDYLALASRTDQDNALPMETIAQTRRLAAQLLQAQPSEIALVGPTSLALSFIASGFPLRKNDNILIYHQDYPSNVYPWMALSEKGVQIRLLNTRELGQIRLVDIQAQIDEKTRLVALASAHFISGFRIDLPAIGGYLHERQIPFCVDGIQTLGAFPTTVENVDFLAADSHKWLLGPSAAGILYVRQPWQERLRPPIHGWHNLRCPNFVAQEELIYPPDSRRYEVGSANLAGLIGLHACLQLILDLGLDKITQELLRKRTWLIPALQAKGYSVLQSSASPAHAAGIISFFREQTDLASLHQKLAQANIVTSLRTDRAGKQYLRLSPHFYNTDAELHHVLEML